MTSSNPFAEHTIKAIRFRFLRAVEFADKNFGDFSIHHQTRTPVEILHHMFMLAKKTEIKIKEGHFNCPDFAPLNFEEEKMRYLEQLEILIAIFKQGIPLDPEFVNRLIQGPLLDMTSHVGQLAMLNGIHGNKVKGVNYFDANL